MDEAVTDPPPPGEAPITAAHRARLMRAATFASVAVAAVLVAVKFGAWLYTDSVALLSTLIDSVLDVLASLINLVAVDHALRPADSSHRFGHGKAEPLAGLGQAAIISLSALFLMYEAVPRLLAPQPVGRGDIGIIVLLFAIVVTLALVVFQRHVVRQTGSTAISADALHYRTDLLINGGVIVALILVSYVDLPIADPIFAIAIGIYILFSVRTIVVTAVAHLMDSEFADADRARIREIVLSHEAALDMHDLRTRRSGINPFIQLHLVVARDISLWDAHIVSDEVETAILKAFPEAEIIIHSDPEGVDEQVATFDP